MEGKIILLVEDNPDHQALTQRALRKAEILNFVVCVKDGEEALDYLYGKGGYSGRDLSRAPGLVLLDLKLTRMDGLELLQRIRADEKLRFLPIVVLTSSKEAKDLTQAYARGANSYVRKAVNFDEFAEGLKLIAMYWLGLNEVPPGI